MTYLLAGLAALAILLLGARAFSKADPGRLALTLRRSGGVLLLLLSFLLLLRGGAAIAIPLALFALTLLGVPLGSWFGLSPGGSERKSSGQKSQVRTQAIEMELDHDSGAMEGECLRGSFAGRPLSSLSGEELRRLLDELRVIDPQGALLIEAYLDRRGEDWREQAGEGGREERSVAAGRMSLKEAYAILGVGQGASQAEIRAAHRKLMLKLHPDQGGSDYLAARINEAKEVLLDRRA